MAPRLTHLWVVWVLVLVTFWLEIFSASSRYFKPKDHTHEKIVKLQERLRQSERLMAKLNLRFNEYRDSVAASGIKIEDTTPWVDPKREIASVFADPQFKVVPHPEIEGNKIFERGREFFIHEDFKKSVSSLNDFIENHSENANLPKAAYLLEESYVQLRNPEMALKAIDLLVSHYPETELAGYALVRLGKIFDEQARPEDAAEIFRTVISQYPKSNAAFLAQKNLKGLAL